MTAGSHGDQQELKGKPPTQKEDRRKKAHNFQLPQKNQPKVKVGNLGTCEPPLSYLSTPSWPKVTCPQVLWNPDEDRENMEMTL